MNATGSKILFQVNARTIRESLGLSESIAIQSKQFDEEKITKFYRDSTNEVKSQTLYKILKPSESIQDMSFPYDVNIFQDEVQVVFSVLSQILGLDNDKLVIEVMLGFLMSLSQSELESKCLNFDKFLVEIIHT